MNIITKVTILHLVLIVFLVSCVIILSGGGKDNNVSASSIRSGNDVYAAEEMTHNARVLKEKLIERQDYTDAKNFVDQEDYSIDYIYRNDTFVVSLKKSPYAETKKLAENWFMDQGFSGFDLCHLNVSFYKNGSNINDDLAPSDYYFTGCPVPAGSTGTN